jgi:hypothetical protein
MLRTLQVLPNPTFGWPIQSFGVPIRSFGGGSYGFTFSTR